MWIVYKQGQKKGELAHVRFHIGMELIASGMAAKHNFDNPEDEPARTEAVKPPVVIDYDAKPPVEKKKKKK
jgi:hypothetical protein